MVVLRKVYYKQVNLLQENKIILQPLAYTLAMISKNLVLGLGNLLKKPMMKKACLC